MSYREDHGAVGRIEAWGPDRAIASGLEGIAQRTLVDIEGGGRALVMALWRDHVELAPLSIARPTRGAVVRAIGPLVIARDDPAPIFGRDPPVAKTDGRGRLTLGMLVFDLQRWIGYGASLIAAGTSDLALHALRHQAAQGQICVVAAPAVTSPAYVTARRRDLSCIHVAAAPDASAAGQWLVPWTAMAIADRLRAPALPVRPGPASGLSRIFYL